MLCIILLALVLKCTFALETQLQNVDWIHEFEEKLSDNGLIIAHLDNFTDNLFGRIGNFAINKGLDPKALKDIDQNFLLARIELKNGKIHGISTIKRYSEVIVNYNHSARRLGIVFPVEFSNLSFTYDYHVTLALIGPKGGMLGVIKNLRMYIELTFDFNTYQAKIEKLSTIQTGAINLTFSGQILDIIINILSQFVSAILHPILVAIVEGIVKNIAHMVVHAVNEFFEKINC